MASCAGALIPVLLAAAGLARPAWGQELGPSTASAPGRIGRVEITVGQIFDTSKEEESAWLFRTANRLHLRTRPVVLERELLFSPGDPFDPELLAETERNLRRFTFLRAARVFPAARPDGTIDVKVKADDAWTLSPAANFRRVGESNEWRFGLGEQNLLGLGKSVSFEVKRSVEGFERQFTYGDRQFLGRRLALDLETRGAPELRHNQIRLGRPFYSSLSEYSWGASFLDRAELRPHFVDGGRAGSLRQRDAVASVQYGRAFRPTTRYVRQGTLSLTRSDTIFRHAADTHAPLPERRLRHDLEVGGRWEYLRFVKVRDINQMARDEDFNIGPRVSAALGYGPRWAGGGSDRWRPALILGAGRRLGVGGFSLAKMGFQSVHSPRALPELSWNADLLAYRRVGLRNTLAAHARYARLVRPGDGAALMLGEESGLRGFGLAPFTGDRLVLFNLENRAQLAEELFRVVALGLVAFVDAGYVWQPGERMRAGDLRSAAGLGLRVGSSRSTDTVPLRIDVAYSFQDPGRRSRWSVSIARAHLFGPD